MKNKPVKQIKSLGFLENFGSSDIIKHVIHYSASVIMVPLREKLYQELSLDPF